MKVYVSRELLIISPELSGLLDPLGKTSSGSAGGAEKYEVLCVSLGGLST